LQAWTDWTPSSRTHRWRRRKKSNAVARAWAWFGGVSVGVIATGILVWQVEDHLHQSVANGSSVSEAALNMIRGEVLAPWQQEVLDSLDRSAEQVGVSELTQAEISVDRAASLLASARLKSQRSDPEFFQMAITGMDRVWNQRPDNDRLFRHVTEARIELATLRAAQNSAMPAANGSAVSSDAPHDPDMIPAVRSDGGGAAARAKVNGRVPITETREVAANATLDPALLGGNYLDATRMPASAEILTLPARRSADDTVRVENLTLAGASQTLDAIHWSNVTFIGTRLRYDKGPLDLENVRFVGCTFELPTDVRGSRLATAIALGQTSFTAE
jgi:hypothetical protein